MEKSVFLFLDFDGVLCPVRESLADERARSTKFVWLPILAEILEPYPEVKILVSSDKRCNLNDDELRALLGPLGKRFHGIVENYDELSRAEEIRTEVGRRGITKWLAIDDHPSVVTASSREQRFIACDSRFGITSSSVQVEIQKKLTELTARTPDRP